MKKLIAITTTLILGAALAACSDSESGSDGAVTVGTIPNASVAPLYLGNEQGTFKDEGLTVKAEHATGFSPNLASVVNGEKEIGFAAVVPLLVARSKGAPIKIIAGTDAAPTKYDAKTDPDNVFVAKDSAIDSAKDLEGKKVAVTALGSIQDLGVRVMVTEDGGDPEAVEFLALPSNDMLAALTKGTVDAVAMSEPFTAAAHKEGLDPLFSYVTSPTPGAPVGAYFTSEQTLQTNAEDIDAFVAAVGTATEYADAHPAEVKKAMTGYTEISSDVISDVHTFPYVSEITEDQISMLSDLLVEYGYMDEAVDAGDVLK